MHAIVVGAAAMLISSGTVGGNAATSGSYLAMRQSEEQGTDLTGCWHGRWESCVNGHDGKLQAMIVKVSQGSYCAEFTGTFWYVLPFRYHALLNAEPQGEAIVLRGGSDLGPLMGTFTYEATVTGNAFHATYSSCNDRGFFQMRRCDDRHCCCN